jgi:hypothetical protein
MVEVGKRYTGTQYAFKGTIIPLDINPETDNVRVKLIYHGTTWEETWNLKDFNWGLDAGEYVELDEDEENPNEK